MIDPLLKPLKAWAFEFPNRMVMAPLTRCRSSAGRVPNEQMAGYYAQRASFGMILSERFHSGAPLNEPDSSTFCGDGPVGYTDYPILINVSTH